MLKRTLTALAVPAILATGLITLGAGAAAAQPDNVECRLFTIGERTSVAHCRYRNDYVHWIRCQDSDGDITVETTRRFTGTRSVVSCSSGYDLVNHAIGA